MLFCLCVPPFSTEPTTRSGSKNMPPDCLQRLHDSAGKFCLDKWTRKGKQRRVEAKDHEEVLHEDVKEDHDVAPHPTARTHSRADLPDGSCEFSQGHPGYASARCARRDLSGCRLCPSVSQTGTSGRSAVETGVGHYLASAGKPLRSPGR